MAVVTIINGRAANLDLSLALTAFRSEGPFLCHTYCDTGLRFVCSHSKDWHLRPTLGFEPDTQGSPNRLCCNHCVMQAASSVSKKPEVVNELCTLHDHCVLVSADKTSNIIVFVCKNYCYGRLLNELGFISTLKPTYTRIHLKKDEFLQKSPFCFKYFQHS
jgi:hypothetical protein